MLSRFGEAYEAGFEWLYERYAERLFRRLRARYPQLEASDLVHDTFVRLLRNEAALLRRFGAELGDAGDEQALEVALERFLWDQACGVAANHRRRFWRRYEVAMTPERTPASWSSPEQRASDSEQLARVDRCLHGKSSRLYLYFKLRYCDGWQPQEIAELTGWPLKSIYRLKQQLDTAIRQCADELDIPFSG